MQIKPLVWIFMGVSGSGKTTIGRLFSQSLNCDFLEGDRRHSANNISKMTAQLPLNDEDRVCWLNRIAEDIKWSIEKQQETVITCSALKKEYRKKLANHPAVKIIWLKVNKVELLARFNSRGNHYMPATLIDSQLDTLEEPGDEEKILTIDANPPIETVIANLNDKLFRIYPALAKPWWQREQA